MGPLCFAIDPCTLRWGDPGVEVVVFPSAGSWVHQLVWSGQDCIAGGCAFEFTATSGYDGCTATSGWTAFGDFGICIE